MKKSTTIAWMIWVRASLILFPFMFTLSLRTHRIPNVRCLHAPCSQTQDKESIARLKERPGVFSLPLAVDFGWILDGTSTGNPWLLVTGAYCCGFWSLFSRPVFGTCGESVEFPVGSLAAMWVTKRPPEVWEIGNPEYPPRPQVMWISMWNSSKTQNVQSPNGNERSAFSINERV